MSLLDVLRAASPLVQHVTNSVTMNDCANATLAIGASPVMSAGAEEAPQMAAIAAALVLNMGTADSAQIEAMVAAGLAAKARGVPVVFDPVGAGATDHRRHAALRVMDRVRPDIVKGNAAELGFLAGRARAQRGVDALQEAEAAAVAEVARRWACVAVATGEEDLLSDGERLLRIRGGNPTLGRVCGTGCMTASLAASFAAVADGDSLGAAAAACLAMKLAGEEAERRSAGAGLASYRVALMDALSRTDAADLEKAARERVAEESAPASGELSGEARPSPAPAIAPTATSIPAARRSGPRLDPRSLRLCLVTDRSFVPDDCFLDLVDAAISGGATMVQLRDKAPGRSSRAVYEDGLRLRALCAARGVAFVVNDRPDLALALDADGLHLGRDDLPLSAARRIWPAGGFVGVSASTAAEAAEAERDGADYVGFGAVFASGTKPEAGESGLAELERAVRAVAVPVVAIGGIGPANAASVLATGCAGLAVVSAVWAAPDPRAAAAALAAIPAIPAIATIAAIPAEPVR